MTHLPRSDTEINHAFWDEIAPHHAASDFYAVRRFLTTHDSLGAVESGELGSVEGLSICHLQCHLGLDTLSLAARGATVIGVDFSAAALEVARDLARRTGLSASFVVADVLDAAPAVGTTVDLVVTTRGVLMWVADLQRWADTCAALLEPGGSLYLLDHHPLALVLGSQDPQTRYLGDGEPVSTVADASYAVRDVGLVHQETREWIHPVGDVITAIARAGLSIDYVHEHDAERAGVDVHWPDQVAGRSLPAMYSLRARRPVDPAAPASGER